MNFPPKTLLQFMLGHHMNSFNFNLWYDSYDPNFTEISKQSLIPEKWITHRSISHNIFDGLPIKPINRYVEFLYPRPELAKISGNTITLTQKNHAEIFLLNNDGHFRNIDRPWMRQYYQTTRKMPAEGCFDQEYIFYVPWFIDEDISITFKNSVNSPFLIFEESAQYEKTYPRTQYIEPKFVLFKFKNHGPHMESDIFAKIKIGSPMFDIVFDADDILLERIRKFYEHN